MFTGIIQELGKVINISPIKNSNQGLNIAINILNKQNFLDDVKIGDSIAINGACMTVVSISNNIFSFDISSHSLSLIVNLAIDKFVNLEKAMRAKDFLGGHIVTGHVDGIAQINTLNKINESYLLTIAIDNNKHELGKFIAKKGSITIDGVSLTVNDLKDINDFTYVDCNLIPHTMENTIFQYLSNVDYVNIEIDVLARYMDRMLNFSKIDR